MGLRGGALVFISQADIADPVSVYTVYRDISKGGLASEMFLEVSRSFHMAMFYL